MPRTRNYGQARQNCVRRRKYLVQVVRADELLQQGDVRVVRRIQREALRKILEQTSVGVPRMMNHRRVWLERNVDRRHRVLLRPCIWRKSDRQAQPEPNSHDDFQVLVHVLLFASV